MAKAHTVEALVKTGPFGRSKLYEEIRDGNLIARKCGRKTLILDEDWERFLKSLPVFDSGTRSPSPWKPRTE